MHITSPVSETRLSWEGIERIEQDFTHVYLFFGAFHAIVVPKQALGGEPGAHRFMQTAAGLLGASSGAAPPPRLTPRAAPHRCASPPPSPGPRTLAAPARAGSAALLWCGRHLGR